MTAPSSASTIIIPQLTYLELISIQIGNSRIGAYWQRASGGEVQVSVARSAPPNMRTTRPLSGKYSVSGIQLEREYTPDTSHTDTVIGILRNLRDPGNTGNEIKIIRELPNTPSGNSKATTKVTYLNCVPTNVPIISDGDTTADANIMNVRLGFEVGDVTVNVGGVEYDIMEWIGGGWNTSASNSIRGISTLNLTNTTTGKVSNGG